jgi:phytoene desaturase
MSQNKKVVVIGAGVAGLASAIRLKARGYEVHVFEASSQAGGKLNQLTLNGYRFDTGPSLFTMPQYVTELFELVGKDSKVNFPYLSLDVICKYWWDDGTELTMTNNNQTNAKSISAALGEKEANVLAYFKRSEQKYNLTGKTFLENSLHRLKTWLTKDVLKALMQLNQLDLLSTMHGLNAKYFKNIKTIQLFDRYATYNGSNPYKAPGMLQIIPHFEYGFGAHLPVRGMYQITESLYQLAVENGVTFHFNNKVDEIVTRNKTVKGIRVGDELISANLVISNMDAYFTYKHLLNREDKAQQITKQERSSSALIFYWGINKSFNELDLHNIFFSEDYKQEFELIAQGEISEDPTVYINITSKYVPGDAPVGCENWFVMINVPHNSGQNWDPMIQKAKQSIIKKINHVLKTDITNLIVCEEVLDPRSIESKTMSYTGSLYGTSSNSKFAAFARHANKSEEYEKLYFVGGSVHPGGGVPLCLLSAKIVDELINE